MDRRVHQHTVSSTWSIIGVVHTESLVSLNSSSLRMCLSVPYPYTSPSPQGPPGDPGRKGNPGIEGDPVSLSLGGVNMSVI